MGVFLSWRSTASVTHKVKACLVSAINTVNITIGHLGSFSRRLPTWRALVAVVWPVKNHVRKLPQNCSQQTNRNVMATGKACLLKMAFLIFTS